MKRLTAREQRNQDSEVRCMYNSSVGSALSEFLSEPSGLATAMGAGGYAGSPAQREDRKERRCFAPASEAEHKRANNGSGEPDYCANCDRPFMDHNNGRCPK